MVELAKKYCCAGVTPDVLLCVGETKYCCRRLNNLIVSKDNIKHIFKMLPNELSKECLEMLICIGIVGPVKVTESGYGISFTSKMKFFHPRRHIPPTNPTTGMNISPVEGYTFSVCRSMQNAQLLTECGSVNKYVCKYIGKIDEQNYVIVSADNKGNDNLITRSTFLHNTKVSLSKYHENEAMKKERDSGHPRGHAVAVTEMLHSMLQ
eukprot:218909-Ditylum_brightwellii.AAC.1